MVNVLAAQPVVDDLVELRARRRRPIQVQERVDSKHKNKVLQRLIENKNHTNYHYIL